MGFICFLISALLLALALQPWFLREDAREGKAALVVLLWFAILVGTNWVLAVPRLICAPALWGCTALFAAAGGGILIARRRRALATAPLQAPSPLVLLVVAAMGISTLYILFRGPLLFVQEYDALTYHFPKAVEILRARTIPHIPSGDFRVAYFPWNYELLLADGLLLTPGDSLSYLLGLMATFGFGSCAYGIFRRSWPEASGTDALLGLVFVCATPVLILQSADYKNDVLFSFLLLSVLYWGVRWCLSGRRRELLLAVLSLALCFGTKATVLFLFPVAAFGAWRYRSRFSPRNLGGPRVLLSSLAGLVLLVFLMGAAWPVLNGVWCGHPLGDTAVVGGMPGFDANAVPRYAGFANLWKFPILAWLRPFSSNPLGLWVFWDHSTWWWPARHPIYSHFGWLCSVLVLFLPAGILLHRRFRGEGAPFRVLLSWATLAFVALSLPQRYRVDGMFCGFPRYLLCLPVLAGLWTLLPALAWARRAGWRRLQPILGLGLVAYFLGQSWIYLAYDTTKPWSLVLDILGDPQARPVGGISFQVDRVAGPRDVIAFDSGFGGMVYPLYGRDYGRPLIFLKAGSGPRIIPPETKWVVIDRAWNVGWSHPGVFSTRDFGLPTRRAPTGEDLALVTQLCNDPEFALVYNDPSSNQAAFLRRKYLSR